MKKPHLRLYSDGKLYLWRGHLLGWKHIGEIAQGEISLHRTEIYLRRTGWPTEFGKYIPQ